MANDGVPELIYEDFVRARDLHMGRSTARSAAASASSNSVPGGSSIGQSSSDDGSFMLYSPGPGEIFAVFEQNAEDGRFYLYDAESKHILHSAHIYDRVNAEVRDDEIDVGWAADDSACGVAVFGQFRAFLGVKSPLELRKPLADEESPGFSEAEWPRGFEHYRENRPQ